LIAESTARRRLGCLALLAIIMLAFFVALIPNRGYSYPVHIDEWQHMTHSELLLETGHIRDVSDPFSGIPALSLGQFEVGFHMFCGMLYEVTGISWMNIVKFLPSIIFVITVLSVYCLARRQGFGYEAAFIAALIPTTVGILGPAFLVPVSIGLLFIPLVLFVAFNLRAIQSYVLMFVLTCALLWIHPPSALAMIIILLPFLVLSLKGDFRHSFGLLLSIAAPFLVALCFAYDFVMTQGIAQIFVADPLPAYHDMAPIMSTYGYVPTILCVLGVFILGTRSGVKNISLILGLLTIAAMVVIYYAFGYGHQIMYLRGMLYMLLMMSIIGGAGLRGIRTLRLPRRLAAPFVTQNIGKWLCCALVVTILVVAIPARENTRFYHMIDEHDYRAFVWIGDNLVDGYQKAILDPWKATAFIALTLKDVHSRILLAPEDEDLETWVFLRGGCNDTTFLNRENISIIYNRWPCVNPDLVEVTNNVYVLP